MLQTSPFVGMSLILRIITTAGQLGSEHLQEEACAWGDAIVVTQGGGVFFWETLVGYEKASAEGPPAHATPQGHQTGVILKHR